MSEKVYIEIDASPWMDAEGVMSSVWLGDACEACYENKKTYRELVKQELEAHTVHGKLTNEYGHDNIATAEEFVIALEEAAKYARKKWEKLQK